MVGDGILVNTTVLLYHKSPFLSITNKLFPYQNCPRTPMHSGAVQPKPLWLFGFKFNYQFVVVLVGDSNFVEFSFLLQVFFVL